MTDTELKNVGVKKKRWVVCFENTILDLDLSIYEKMVYIVLCSHAKKDGPAFPSVRTIAKEASCSRTKVFEALKTLEEQGIITRDHRIFEGRGQTSNLYEINDITPRPQNEQGGDGNVPSPSVERTEEFAARTGGVREADAHIKVFEQDHLNKTKEQLTPPTPPEAPGGRNGEGDFENLKQKTQETEKKDYDTGEKAASLSLEPEVYDAIREIYNTVLPELVQAEKITFSRARVLKHRLREDPARRNPDWWRGFFKRVRDCPWLMGNNTSNWRANFDWLIGEKGMQKILEGTFQRSSGLSLQEKYMSKEGLLDAKALLRDPAFLAYR
jgi:DNA-binding Lrp family transcriptional regulator